MAGFWLDNVRIGNVQQFRAIKSEESRAGYPWPEKDNQRASFSIIPIKPLQEAGESLALSAATRSIQGFVRRTDSYFKVSVLF